MPSSKNLKNKPSLKNKLIDFFDRFYIDLKLSRDDRAALRNIDHSAGFLTLVAPGHTKLWRPRAKA